MVSIARGAPLARIFAIGIVLQFSAPAFAEVDAVAAKQLALDSNCLRCHAVAKKKEGPTYQSVALKYKDRPDAQEKLLHHITSGEKVKLTDGHQEDHKIVRSTDATQTRNLVAWILQQ